MQRGEGSDNLADYLADMSTSPDVMPPSPAKPMAEDDDEPAEVLFDDEDPAEQEDADAEESESVDITNFDEFESEDQRQLTEAAFHRTRRHMSRRVDLSRRHSSVLRKAAIGLLITIGVALMVPGIWSIGYFAGWGVWLSGKEKAEPLAVIMLICWPLTLLCFVSAVFMFIGLTQRRRHH